MLTIESLIAVLSFGLSCFGLGYIGNKTQKNTVCIFIEKQNRMSDTRGETIRHNMQKST